MDWATTIVEYTLENNVDGRVLKREEGGGKATIYVCGCSMDDCSPNEEDKCGLRMLVKIELRSAKIGIRVTNDLVPYYRTMFTDNIRNRVRFIEDIEVTKLGLENHQ